MKELLDGIESTKEYEEEDSVMNQSSLNEMDVFELKLEVDRLKRIVESQNSLFETRLRTELDNFKKDLLREIILRSP